MYLIEIRSVERDYVEIIKNRPDLLTFKLENMELKEETLDIERIYGERFYYNSLEYCISMTKDAQVIFNIPFESFKSMDNTITINEEIIRLLKKENKELTEFKNKMTNMPFLARLKFLFKGDI